MTIRDLLRNTLMTPSLLPAARTNGTFNGNTIDLRGFDSAFITVSFGAWTDGTHTPSVQESTDGVNFTNAATTDIDGTLAAISSSAGSNTAQSVGYIGAQRYVRVVMTVSGATNGAFSSADVIAGHPHNAPTQ
jgi:hypothetical protein